MLFCRNGDRPNKSQCARVRLDWMDDDDDDVRRLLFGKLYILINLHNEVMNNDCAKWLKNMRFIEFAPQKKELTFSTTNNHTIHYSVILINFNACENGEKRKKWPRNELLLRSVNCTLIIKMVWIFATEANTLWGIFGGKKTGRICTVQVTSIVSFEVSTNFLVIEIPYLSSAIAVLLVWLLMKALIWDRFSYLIGTLGSN